MMYFYCYRNWTLFFQYISRTVLGNSCQKHIRSFGRVEFGKSHWFLPYTGLVLHFQAVCMYRQWLRGYSFFIFFSIHMCTIYFTQTFKQILKAKTIPYNGRQATIALLSLGWSTGQRDFRLHPTPASSAVMAPWKSYWNFMNLSFHI